MNSEQPSSPTTRIEHSDWVVLKFGGTSVSSTERWQTIAKVISNRRKEGHRVLVVCSALSGISNLLEKLQHQLDHGQDTDHLLEEFRQRHRDLCESMGLDAQELVGEFFEDLERLTDGVRMIGQLTDDVRARIMSTGELCSTTIGTHWLIKEGLKADWKDARQLLQTLPAPVEATLSRRYLSATCDYAPDEDLATTLNGSEIVITQGFIASDPQDKTVLLGRGGSDTSGSYFSAKLRANRLEIWTDVPGMFTTNPNDRPDARLLRLIGYEEAQVLAAMGARVLHPRCIPPVREYQIPLHIRCTPAPDMEGTVISSEADEIEPTVKAVSTRHKLFHFQLRCPGRWHEFGLLADLTHVFKRHSLPIDLIANSPQRISVTLDPAVVSLGPVEKENLLRDLEEFGVTEFSHAAGSVSLVGSNIGSVIGKLAGAMKNVESGRMHMVSQAASDDGLSFILEPEDVDRLMNPLHDWLLSGEIPERVFGPSWEELSKQIQGN